ncbi:hypothetical protein SAMN06265222_107296 [Neorhodopirellula lusitana]|uniref:Uncharacterized protein n=1 Tax=Neorhodopirellula lusitana TaxID=445327 RepID=A0ABY1Q870_9BACT|nr:hypothetical protein [Neorhodopirellula lusitana]SMP62348.1 hypothetical protein SAMN06265222_107296 [Neorhodopirellula lusitana]
MWTVQAPSEQEAVNDSELLVGHCIADGHDWVCRAGGGTDGISLGDPDGSLHVSVFGGSSVKPGKLDLPVAAERYVRGDEWKISYPQGESEFSLRLSIRIVEATSTRLVLEPTFSIQTSLLDTHPTLLLKAIGGKTAGSTIPNASELGDFTASTLDLTGGAGSVSILVGPRDTAYATDRSTSDRLELQLFGDFLEKGVICKVRPWIILDRSDVAITSDELLAYAKQLSETPLPLTE